MTSRHLEQVILPVSKAGNDNVGEAWRDNVALDYAGVRATDLQPAQRQQLSDLNALYVDNMDDGHA